MILGQVRSGNSGHAGERQKDFRIAAADEEKQGGSGGKDIQAVQ